MIKNIFFSIKMSTGKIYSPKSRRPIIIHGDAFNKLVTSKEYTENYLLSLPRIGHTEITPSKYETSDVIEKITGIDDIDIYILSQLDNKSLVRACQTNKQLHNLCYNNKVLFDRIKAYLDEFDKQFNAMKRRIGCAIIIDNNKKGSTRPLIKKYLETNYKIEPTDPWINRTIRILTSLEKGERLIPNRHHKGHYRLSPEYKKTLNYNK